MYKAGVVTCSDKGYQGLRIDESGKIIKEILENRGFQVEKYIVLPDDRSEIVSELKYMTDELKLNLILTTGGTGFSKRDVTPEASRDVIEREAYGIAEAIRYYSLSITKRAMLSRAVSGIRGNCLIVNLPGSPKAVREALEYIIDTIIHGLDILTNQDGECAR